MDRTVCVAGHPCESIRLIYVLAQDQFLATSFLKQKYTWENFFELKRKMLT